MEIEQRREKQRNLTKQFQDPNDHVGQAFQTLCKAGMNEEYFRNFLFSMMLTPHKRKRKAYSEKDVKKLRAIARNIEGAANALCQRQFRVLLSLSSVTDWPISLEDCVPILRGFASCIRRSLEGPHEWREMQPYLASHRIPVLIREITQITGKPHYKELATLLSAVYDKEIWEDTLKVEMARYRKERGKPKKSG